MSVLSKPRFYIALSLLALGGLAACERAASPAAAPSETTLAAESLAPMPTIVPNADPIASFHPNSIQPETTLTISAQGEVRRAPDMAVISAGVETEADTAAKAMQDNAKAMNGVFKALEAAKVARRDMQTSNLSLQPRYDYSNRDGQPPKLIGYTASNQLSVTVRDLDRLGQTLDSLVEAGGNTFSGLSFALNDDRAALDEARQEAMQTAIARAELYAKASGYRVARIVTVSEDAGYAPQPMAMMATRSMANDSTPIASGEVGYSVTVNVVFELRK